MSVTSWHVYVLECADGTLYCGITTDVERRVRQHQQGSAARYTRGRGPVVLRLTWCCGGRAEALKAEAAFKRLSKQQKWLRLRAG